MRGTTIVGTADTTGATIGVRTAVTTVATAATIGVIIGVPTGATIGARAVATTGENERHGGGKAHCSVPLSSSARVPQRYERAVRNAKRPINLDAYLGSPSRLQLHPSLAIAREATTRDMVLEQPLSVWA